MSKKRASSAAKKVKKAPVRAGVVASRVAKSKTASKKAPKTTRKIANSGLTPSKLAIPHLTKPRLSMPRLTAPRFAMPGFVMPGFLLGIASYFRGVREEAMRVTWPTRQETIQKTLTVIVVSAIVGLFIGGLDFGLTHLTGLLVQ